MSGNQGQPRPDAGIFNSGIRPGLAPYFFAAGFAAAAVAGLA